jgi:polyisoprenyl-teichoic acid--peptidoglycan teichoic acid transferase
MGHAMKRIGKFLGRVIVIIVGLVAIFLLTRAAVNGVNDLIQRFNTRRFHDEQRAAFPGTATQIGILNADLIYQKTHAPTATITPTEGEEGDTTGDSQAMQVANTDLVPETAPPPTEAPTDTPTEEPTDIPTSSPTEAPTDTPTVTSTLTSTPTALPTATNTRTPTSTIPPTRVAQQPTIPPTNTKRAAANATTKATATAPSTSTARATPTSAATTPPSQAATAAPTSAQAAGPTAAATSKLPTVVAFSECTSKPQATAVPTRAPRVRANGNDIMNILLVGTDADVDPTDPSFRTDSMVIVSINRTANSVSMLSIPRDLYVCIPDYGMQRINVAYTWGQAVNFRPGGGFGALQATILYNLGIPVHYYAKISLLGFKKIIDTLSGVDIAVDCRITDLRFQGQYNDKQTPVYAPFTLDPGFYHMDGSLALWYARMREKTSDFDRSRRQQQVLRAIWRTAREQGLISKAPELWGQVTSIVDTNLQLADALGLVPMALNLKPGDVRSFYMQKGIELAHWRTPQGEDVQIPDPPGFFRTINDFYTPPTGNRLGKDVGSVEVLNGTPNNNLDKVASDRLTWEGFDVQPKGGTEPTDKTVVYDFTGSAKPGVLNVMLKALNLRQDRVISQPDPNRTVDYRIVLGQDYHSCSVPGFG